MDNIYEIRSDSLEYIPVRVKATKLGDDYDPTADDVKIALPVINVAPVLADWKSASWQTYGGKHFANILVGPGGDVQLGVGDYDILVQITDSPEQPILRAGMLRVVNA